MDIAVGGKMPVGVFGVMTEDGPASMSTEELFAGKKVVLVSVPGAFTPTCSGSHLPGYIDHAEELADKGVETIAFMAVNDTFVMHAWGKDRGVADKVLMLSDGNGEYVRALGLELDGTASGMGMRGQRFALVVEDGTVTHVAVEAPRKFEVSNAESVLQNL